MKKLLLCVILMGLSGCDSSSTSITPSTQTAVQEQSQPDAPAIEWPYNDAEIAALPPSTDVDEMLRANYWVVFDDSGSMEDKTCDGSGVDRLTAAKRALEEFYNLVPADANFGVVLINNLGTPLVPLAQKSSQQQVVDKIRSISTNGGTPLKAATLSAYEVLTTQGLHQSGYGNYNVVIITDGESGDGDIGSNINYMVDKTRITVHAIGLCSDANKALNQSGRTFYTSAKNTADLKKGFESVLAETDETFVSTNESF